MKRVWLILAAVGGALAVYFTIRNDFEKAFIAAAAGAVCWFLNYRQHLKASLPKDDDYEDEESDEEIRS